eukprot:4285184-Pleurochrysis_carterae.AAC.2
MGDGAARALARVTTAPRSAVQGLCFESLGLMTARGENGHARIWPDTRISPFSRVSSVPACYSPPATCCPPSRGSPTSGRVKPRPSPLSNAPSLPCPHASP